MTTETRVAESDASPISPLERFHWQPQPAAEQFLLGVVEQFVARTPYAAMLSRRMTEQTGTRFFDWIESIRLPSDLRVQVVEAGFRPIESDIDGVHAHDGGMFPKLIVDLSDQTVVTLRVESVADFAASAGLPLLSSDEPLSTYRRALVGRGESTELWVAERHGFAGFLAQKLAPTRRIAMLRHLERFRTRPRDFATDAAGFDAAEVLLDDAITELDADVTCDLFFAAEREYWQRRNRAAQAQKARQDRLGLGWANHDHHTYRSSRRSFSRLIGLLEKLGFHCRERFYAGAAAGWGAQVLEQPNARVVIFADVDLAPEELLGDFSHDGLAPRDTLGTVGLWCALHGEAFLQAGMHHLECQFDFNALAEQMQRDAGIKVMKPFTDFPYLRQAFTEGERWAVRPERIERLLTAGLITPSQADTFCQHGAIGSHLENLERNQGFKGFNQTGVSDIIARTDPRKQDTLHG